MKTLKLFRLYSCITLLLFCGFSSSILAQVTIGSGTSTQRYPLGAYWGYERSASLYTAAEISTSGSITNLAWYPTETSSISRPIKIFNISAQTEAPVERIKVLDLGNSKLENGSCVIKLDYPCENYSVILTPIGDYYNLFVSEKRKTEFIVKCIDCTEAEFDYVLIEKKVKYRLDAVDSKKIE
ncbi:MAG: hypothetical protein RBR74_09300 [Ignavibacteriaceae bacterium]|jgi:hypothetical protein|nr:hypothetical protein [Ignavibacteriaceae bacterium]